MLPYVDGFNHVAKIAAEVDIEINLVKAFHRICFMYSVMSSADEYANSLDPDQDLQNVGPDLGPNCFDT